MQDTFKHQGLRRKLVDVVRKKGIKDESVLFCEPSHTLR